MICLEKNGTIVFGPAPWNVSAILEPLIIAGCDLADGALYGPDKTVLCHFPTLEPVEPVELGAFRVLPVAEVNEPAPEGKALAGREPVVLEDRVELRPVWGDLPPPPTLEEVKTAKKAGATAMRRMVEEGGIDFQGVRIATGKSDQDRIAGVQLYLQAHSEAVIDWKADSGWTTVNKAAIDAIASAVGAHVQACYSAEKTHHEAIDALADAEAVQDYDVATGWPE